MPSSVLGAGTARHWQECQGSLDSCHVLVHHGAMARSMSAVSGSPLRSPISDVVAIVADGAAAFGLGVVCEVFALHRSSDVRPTYDFALATVQLVPNRTSSGF